MATLVDPEAKEQHGAASTKALDQEIEEAVVKAVKHAVVEGGTMALIVVMEIVVGVIIITLFRHHFGPYQIPLQPLAIVDDIAAGKSAIGAIGVSEEVFEMHLHHIILPQAIARHP